MNDARRQRSIKRYVGGLVFDGQRVLLGKRSATRARYPGVWDVFGGRIEANETPGQALRREMREEIGIRVGSTRRVGVVSGISPDRAAPFVMTVFLITGWTGRIRLCNREHEELSWFDMDELEALIGVVDERLPEFVRRAVSSGDSDWAKVSYPASEASGRHIGASKNDAPDRC
jgi:8-oxo-dGTP diphosphatase